MNVHDVEVIDFVKNVLPKFYAADGTTEITGRDIQSAPRGTVFYAQNDVDTKTRKRFVKE